MVMTARWRCSCESCLRFRLQADAYSVARNIPTDDSLWRLRKTFPDLPKGFWWNQYREGTCGICGDLSKSKEGYIWRPLIPWVPEIVAEFFETKDICNICRNVISCFLERWQICLSGSPDWAIKWGLLEAYLRHWWKMHLPNGGRRWSGVYSEGGFHELSCCKRNVSHAKRGS